jgi:hypothetical protein
MDTADRFEYKFLLTLDQRAALLARLDGELRPDTQGGSEGHYPIVSLYYDSPDRRCYWDNWRGVPSRRKLRVRVYGSEDGAIRPTSFIEVKHKADGRGVKRRVQTTLARALAQQPAVLLADEPVASLDPEAGATVLRLLRDCCRDRQAAVVCSLHQPALALEHADRVVALRGGRVVLDAPAGALDASALAAIYR